MSKICILVLSKPGVNMKLLEEITRLEADHIDCGVFFTFDYREPVIEQYKNSAFICSFSDDYRFDNCEMLLLPDDCWSHTKTNLVPFHRRMELLRDAIVQICITAQTDKVDLFIGDSGTCYDDFELVQTTFSDFPDVIDQLVNNIGFPQLRFVIKK